MQKPWQNGWLSGDSEGRTGGILVLPLWRVLQYGTEETFTLARKSLKKFPSLDWVQFKVHQVFGLGTESQQTVLIHCWIDEAAAAKSSWLPGQSFLSLYHMFSIQSKGHCSAAPIPLSWPASAAHGSAIKSTGASSTKKWVTPPEKRHRSRTFFFQNKQILKYKPISPPQYLLAAVQQHRNSNKLERQSNLHSCLQASPYNLHLICLCHGLKPGSCLIGLCWP